MEHLDDIFREGLEELELPCSKARIGPWSQFATLLHGWNRQINLTGHQSPQQIARRLLLEAAALAQQLPPFGSLADIGSGAGIPGIPIALCHPGARVLLVEARERRHHFQRKAVRELGIANAKPLLGRSDEIAVQPCDGVVAQALARPDRALATLLPWARPGGWIALATTPDAPPLQTPDLSASEQRSYRAPGGGPERVLWIGWLRGAADSPSP